MRSDDQPQRLSFCHFSSGVNCSALRIPNLGLTMSCGGALASTVRGFFAVRYQRCGFLGSELMAFRRSFGRAIGLAILALTPWVLFAIRVHAQMPLNLP